MRETELFEPVRDYLQQQGFAVAAEVRHCDVAARKDDELVIIELKTSLNLTLVGQAVRRQSVADAVYVAIPEPKRITKTLKQSQRVLARLGLGLLTIRFGPLRTSVNCRLEPSYRGRLDRRERNRILKEMDGRSLQLNTEATAALRGDFRRMGRPRAMAISDSTGQWGIGESRETAVSNCGQEDCRVVVVD